MLNRTKSFISKIRKCTWPSTGDDGEQDTGLGLKELQIVAKLLRKSQPRLCLDMAAGWRSHGPCPDPPLCRCVLDGRSNSWHSNCSSPFGTVLAPSLIFYGGESHFLCVVGKLAPKTTGDDDLDLASVWTRWVSALGAGGTTRWKSDSFASFRSPASGPGGPGQQVSGTLWDA